MELLYLVKPTIEYKKQGIEYIEEYYEYSSPIHGVGGLSRYLDDYEGWLEHLDYMTKIEPNEDLVPSETYYLVRYDDNKIIGMISIRLDLNDKLKKLGGHIGYGIRPTERRKGYNKINLYLGLLKCREHGIKEVKIDCDKVNLGSKRTIESLGGILENEYYSDEMNCTVLNYVIDVEKSLKENEDIYSKKIYRK